MQAISIEPLFDPTEVDLDQLATLLLANVLGGASVSFILPFNHEDALAWWRTKVLPPLSTGQRILMVASQNNEIIGSVQLILGMPPNQPHRADVAKLLVHPKARRQGVARMLMVELERLAASNGRALLTLDTVTGSAAEPLYQSLGYKLSGCIPGYALNTASTQLESTSIYYKQI